MYIYSHECMSIILWFYEWYIKYEYIYNNPCERSQASVWALSIHIKFMYTDRMRGYLAHVYSFIFCDDDLNQTKYKNQFQYIWKNIEDNLTGLKKSFSHHHQSEYKYHTNIHTLHSSRLSRLLIYLYNSIASNPFYQHAPSIFELVITEDCQHQQLQRHYNCI